MENLKEWAEWIVEANEKIKNSNSKDIDIIYIDKGHVLLNRGIYKLAEAIGAEVKEEQFKGEEYEKRYDFTYKGIDFCQIAEQGDQL